MDISPRTRVLKRMTGECLRLVRTTSKLPVAEAEQFLKDLPQRMQEWMESLRCPPEDAHVLELPGYAGYSLWAPTYDDDPSNQVILAEEDHIWDIIGSVQGKRILDAGSGTGRHSIRLSASGATVVASEPNEALLAIAKAKDRLGAVEWRTHDIEGLPLALGKFDIVLCCLVLSHVSDLGVAVAKLSQFVSDGGALIISDFHPFNLLIGWRTSFFCGGRKYVVPNYLHLPSEYFGALRRAGLDVELFKEVGGFPQLPEQPATIIMKARKPTNGSA